MPELLNIDEFEAKAEQTYINAILGGGLALQFNGALGHHVNIGRTHLDSVDYGAFCMDAWVLADTDDVGAVYVWSEGSGGQHKPLFGASMASGKCYPTGNIYDTSTLRDFSMTGEGFPLNEPTHLQFAWDGAHVMWWINGCLSYIEPFTGTRQSAVNASNGISYIGGSDHQGWFGKIWQVRLQEALCRWNTDIFPERYFRPMYWNGTTFEMCHFLYNFMTPGTIFPNLGKGFNGIQNHGVLGSKRMSADENIAFFDSLYPSHVIGYIVPPTTSPTPPSTPGSAIVFDSFSRPDTTYAFYKDGDSVTGSTETGSAGVKAWSRQSWPVRDGRLAYWHNYGTDNRITGLGLANYDVRVSRINNTFCKTGLVLRYQNASNYINIEAAPDSIRIAKVEAGVTTNVDFTGLSTSWTILKAVINGANIEVFRDGNSVGSTTTTVSGNGDPGLFAPGSGTKAVTRFDDFTVLAA